jgi:hypothetical protein
LKRRMSFPTLKLLAATAVISMVAPNSGLAGKSLLTWESAFPLQSSGEAGVYFSARYFEPSSGWHDLEVWRHAERFLHRRTDGQLDLYVVAGPDGPPSYSYRVLDQRRHVVIDVDHANLYRIGVFHDWFGLAHVLDRPRQSYRLQRTAARQDERERGCRWVLLRRGRAQANHDTRICWSAAWGIPLRIREATAKGRWEDRFVIQSVQAMEQGPTAWSVPPTPTGWARFDANQEINPHQGD